MPRICTPLFISDSILASYSRMTSPNVSWVHRKLFGDFRTVRPTMAPSSTVNGAVPLQATQPSRLFPLKIGRQASSAPSGAARTVTAHMAAKRCFMSGFSLNLRSAFGSSPVDASLSLEP